MGGGFQKEKPEAGASSKTFTKQELGNEEKAEVLDRVKKKETNTKPLEPNT
tara:strand:- start:19238 stop:19390 length:153 start_codon:yes stop_codon:yes gene_type:complete